jgi:hypothetical protein
MAPSSSNGRAVYFVASEIQRKNLERARPSIGVTRLDPRNSSDRQEAGGQSVGDNRTPVSAISLRYSGEYGSAIWWRSN